MWKSTGIALNLILLVIAVRGSVAAQADRGSLGASLDNYLTALVPYGFTGSVLVEQGGEVVLSKGYGMAHEATQRPVTIGTIYSIGSVTKHFTATAVMLLVQRGQLALDDPIGDYIGGVPADKAAISVRHLLSHTSGLPGFENIAAGGSPSDLYAELLGAPLDAAPGTRYRYSNAGYALLARVIEGASGQPYREYMHEHLFEPAGMTRTGFLEDGYTEDDLAYGYLGFTEDGSPLTWPRDDQAFLGAGGILSTPEDLRAWSLALREGRILDTAALEAMLTPFQALGPDVGEVYGGALRVLPSGARRFSAFGGSVPGHNVGLAIGFEEGLTLVVASGRVLDGADLSNVLISLRDIVDGRTPDMPPPPAMLESLAGYEGVYALESGGTLRAEADNGRLILTAEGQDAISALFGLDAELTADLADLNARLLPMIEAAIGSDPSGLASLTGGQMSAAEVGSFWRDRMAFWQENFGAFERVESVGSLPELQETVSLVRLNFANGSILFRFTWAPDGMLIGFGRADDPPNALAILPVSETDFAAFNFRVRLTARVGFATDAGAVTAMNLPGGTQARRLA